MRPAISRTPITFPPNAWTPVVGSLTSSSSVLWVLWRRVVQQERPHSSLDGITPDQPTSTSCPSAWQPNHGRRSTHQRGNLFRQRGPPQITSWKAQLEGGAADVFGPGGGNGAAQPAVDVKSLHAKIGELTLENDFLEGALTKAGLLSARR
jgi:hypothetical protein